MLKRFCCIFLCFFVTLSAFPTLSHAAATDDATAFRDIDARSAILMEASTGTVLFEKNADEALPPASVTKVMTMLLVLEAIDAGQIKKEDTITGGTPQGDGDLSGITFEITNESTHSVRVDGKDHH